MSNDCLVLGENLVLSVAFSTLRQKRASSPLTHSRHIPETEHHTLSGDVPEVVKTGGGWLG